jgi:hypothetical protein
MFRNEGGIIVFVAKDAAGLNFSGDAANITVFISLDGADAVSPVDPTVREIGTTGTYYVVLEPGESVADLIVGQASTITPNITFDPVSIYTESARRAGRSEQKPVGKWDIETLTLSDLKASVGLKEPKNALEAKLPRAEFDKATYPNMADEFIGVSIPIGFGQNFGARAYPINPLTSRFKWIGHAVTSAQSFYDGDGVIFTPDSINLSTGEFTYTGWDGSSELYVDYTADLDNPVDLMKEVFTGSVRGVGLPLDFLDTASTGKGFGTNGARIHYIIGTNTATNAEVSLYQMGLHIDEPTEVRDILAIIQENSFSFIFQDLAGLWQFKPWLPVPGEGLDVISKDINDGENKPMVSVAGSATKVIAKYRINDIKKSAQRVIASDDERRQLRGLTAHTVLEKNLRMVNRNGATDWVQKTNYMRGRPRRSFKFRATSELKQAEPGDFWRLSYAPQNIDEIVMLTSVRQVPGEMTVDVEAIDNFAFRSEVGFYTADAPLTFPASLGGGSFSDWSDANTPEKKLWVKENWGIYHDDNGYIDELDPEASYREAVYW